MHDDILIKLSELASIFKDGDYKLNSNGLMGGKTGVALFLFHYSKLTNDHKDFDIAYDLLFDAFDSINKGFRQHTFANGIAGIGWAVEHLIQCNLLEKEVSLVLDDLDDFMFKSMMHDIRKGNYDYLHGAIGNGIYFLNRLHKPTSKIYLTQLVEELENISKIENDGSIKWESVLDVNTVVKGYNISLSHGVASIIFFLSKLYKMGICDAKVNILLHGSVKYLLKQEFVGVKQDSMFPSFALESCAEVSSSRLAWCYGDLGIGTALWHAAKSSSNNKWENKALAVLLHSAKRRDLDKNRVLDAGLCHGTAGVAHVYNRMYRNTGLKDFKDAREYWIKETLKKAMYENGYAGYKAWRSADHSGLVKEPGFLEGIAGIGLALISSISDIEPNWDSCLLLS